MTLRIVFSKLMFTGLLTLLPWAASAQAVAAHVLVVAPGAPHASLESLIGSARQAPGTLFYATGNEAAKAQGAAFIERQKVPMVNIPYRAPGFAVADLVAGHVHAAVVTEEQARQLVAQGKVRSLGRLLDEGPAPSPGTPAVPAAPITLVPGTSS